MILLKHRVYYLEMFYFVNDPIWFLIKTVLIRTNDIM